MVNPTSRLNYKIAVIGSADPKNITIENKKKAYEIGRLVAQKNNYILLTGGSRGISEYAAKGAKTNNGLTVGISPANNLEEHKKIFKAPVDVFDILVFTGFGYKGRNVVLIRSCDAVVAIDGGIGTLNELTISLDEGKIIGVLSGTGGVEDSFLNFFKKIRKDKRYSGRVVSSSEPDALISKLVNKL